MGLGLGLGLGFNPNLLGGGHATRAHVHARVLAPPGWVRVRVRV